MISIIIISKDEAALDDTATDVIRQAKDIGEATEIIIVDASDGRLDHIRQRHEGNVRWMRFKRPPGVRVSIPHQRNVGVAAAHGDIIVFTDAGCRPEHGWLANLVHPILHEDEHVAAGLTLGPADGRGLYDASAVQALKSRYLRECPTINLAFSRTTFDAVGGFDEAFAYGSDIDFTWRLTDYGYRIRSAPNAIVRHDWGGRRRQLRRSFVYGKARMRLYKKHSKRWRHVLRDDPMVVVYPAFLLGLPLTAAFPFYPALLLIPAWRNRANGPVMVLTDHLVYGLGVLAELLAR
jgi:GT2 family glycosyltransferase